MPFARPAVRRSSPDAVVHAVGQRVYIHQSANGLAHVDLMNEEGTAAIARLADGMEVIVVAWRPRGATGTRYRVRCARDGVEGWLAVANLRRTPTAAAPLVTPEPPVKSASAPPAPPARDAKARFGGR